MNIPMKRNLASLAILGAVAACAVLTGCAAPRQQAYAKPVNPYEWHTVSVTPVPPGSRVVAGSTPRVEYTTEEIRPAPQRVGQRVEYTSEPYPAYPAAYPASSVHVAPPVYAPAPAYYYPAVTIGLDFVFGNWGRRHHHHRHGRRR